MLIKTGCLRGRVFATRSEANLALFEYIDGFDHSRRIHERLGFLSQSSSRRSTTPSRRRPNRRT